MTPLSPTSCSNCALAGLCLPAGLNEQELSTLNKLIKKRTTIKRGESLYTKGSAFKALYAVRSGSFKAKRPLREDEEQIINFYLPGELVGFEAIYSKEYTATVIALETSSLCEIPFNELLKLANEIPTLQQHLLGLMSQKMAPEFLINLNNSAEERIATFLLSLSARF